MPEKPYFLVLHAATPRHVLYPYDAASPGYRIMEMIRLVRPLDKDAWLRGTHRVSLLGGDVLPRDYRSAARRRGRFLAPLLADRVVVLLGAEIAAALDHDAPPYVWSGNWIRIPYPDSRNQFFDNHVARLATGILLSEIFNMTEGAI